MWEGQRTWPGCHVVRDNAVRPNYPTAPPDASSGHITADTICHLSLITLGTGCQENLFFCHCPATWLLPNMRQCPTCGTVSSLVTSLFPLCQGFWETECFVQEMWRYLRVSLFCSTSVGYSCLPKVSWLLSPFPVVLVYSGCCNKVPQTGLPTQQRFVFS